MVTLIKYVKAPLVRGAHGILIFKLTLLLVYLDLDI